MEQVWFVNNQACFWKSKTLYNDRVCQNGSLYKILQIFEQSPFFFLYKKYFKAILYCLIVVVGRNFIFDISEFQIQFLLMKNKIEIVLFETLKKWLLQDLSSWVAEDIP